MATKTTTRKTEVTPIPKAESPKRRAATADLAGAVSKAEAAAKRSAARIRAQKARLDARERVETEVAETLARVAADLNEPKLGSTRTEIVELAKAEKAMLDEWARNGERPPRPATPNLDHLGKPAAARQKAVKASQGRSPRAGTHPRAAAAAATKRAAHNKRGPGVKVTDEQIVEHLRTAVAEHPDTTAKVEQEVMYWTLGWAVSPTRTAKAWEVATRP